MSVRFGIIGTGRITRRLVADLQSTDNVSVSAIASRTDERARWYADQYGIANAVTGYQELIDRDDVDAVYISLPPSLHKEWSIAAANASKHILCEKPLALTTDEATQIDQAAKANQVRWLDATAWLHHGRTQAIASAIADGRLGKVGHISAAVSFFQPFQSGDHRLDASLGGGCLLDLAWYAGGLIRFAAKGLPTKVFASAIDDSEIGSGVPQRVTAMLWFDDNVTATLSCGYDTATRKWFEIAGSAASVVCDDFTRPWADKPARCWIHAASGDVQQLAYEGNQEQEMILRLIGDSPLDSLQCQAIDTHRILDALAESIRLGEPVSV
ncbi:Gfo/Idh/MocA family protein [Planctomycetes bacterium K23_9]|uniref:1,5-anhydro-D-fructose reductase n=1 Tax=Stieleria marina TaxID=1930275 RepID=A0A517NT00_9BACT|nr:1,5-anhydro-D-fructose reductase [Planctomycetes bacterium K23_9]